MAEETKEKTEKKKAKYKYGEHELDLGNYIHNLGTNLNSYLDTRKDWSEGLRLEFTAAFDKYLNGLKEQYNTGVERFNTTSYGRIIDNTGVLNNTDDDGIDGEGSEYYYNDKGEQITSKDYNNLKKRKQKKYSTFSANREVADYFKRIGEKIKNKNIALKEEAVSYFDFGTDGFNQWHSKKYNPAGGEFDYQSILDLDKFENGVRGTKNRLASLAGDLRGFAAELDSSKDYSKTPFGSHEALKLHYEDLAARIEDADGLSEQDYLDFNRAGISRNMLKPYTHTGEKLLTAAEQNTADAQKLAEADAAKRKEQEEAYSKMMGERLNIYKANAGQWNENDAYALGGLTYWNPTTGFDQAGFDASFNKAVAPEYYDAQGKFTGIDKYINDYLTGDKLFTPEGKRALSAIIGAGKYETIEAGPYKGKFYIPLTTDRTTNMGLVYDPVAGGLQRVFIGDLPSQAERIKREWMEAQGIINREDRYKLFKEGGTIDLMLLGGGFSMDAWMTENRDKELKERAKKAGRTEEQQRAGERKTNEDARDPSNPEAEWKATDTARVAASIADIGSMISAFLPGAGTVASAGLGIGSSLTTFGADWAEDGLDWGDVGNLGANLGLDVLGLIPGGGAASKGVKIAKTLGKYASRAMAAVAGMQGLANSNNIIQSINKMTTDPTNLTVDDWRNISQGFGLLTGGVAAGTRKVKKTIAEADMKAKANGAIAVELKDAQGNTKMVAFDGNDAKAIREAQKSGDLKKLREATVGKYELFRDWDLATTGNTGWRSVKGDDGWLLPWGAKEGKARIFDMYGDKNGNLFTKGGNWDADVKVGKPIDSTTELQTATVDKAVEVNKKALLDKLKGISELSVKHEKRLNDIITGKNKSFKDDITLKQEALNTANASNDPNQITAANNALQDALSKQLDWQTRRAKLQQAIADIRAGKYYDKWKSANLQGTGTDAVLVVPSNPYNRPASLLAFEQILKDLKLTPNYLTYAKGGRLERIARFKSGGPSQIKNVVNPGDWFDNMFMSSYMLKWIGGFDPTKEDTWKTFNTLQGSWRTNKTNTGYNGQYAVRDKTDGVRNRQAEWNKTGTNAAFEEIQGLKRNGGTSDNPAGGYVDGVFGAQEDFRHGGTKEYFDANPEKLKLAKEIFTKLGFNYDLNTTNNMYEISPILKAEGAPQATPEVPETTPETPQTTPGGTDPAARNTTSNNTSSNRGYKNGLLGRLSNIFNGPLPYRFARIFTLDDANQEMTDLMKLAEIPIYKNWALHNDTIKSDLAGEMRGTKAKAELQSKAGNMQTSDIDKYLAANMEATRIGLDMENEAKYKSDLVAREDAERAAINNYQDRVVATEASNVNRAAGISTAANKLKHDAALVAKTGANKAGVLALFEHDAATKLLENKAALDALIRSDIHNSALNRAITEGVSMGLTMEQVALLLQMKEGKSLSAFTSDEQKQLRAAMDIITEEETSEWAKYKGLSRYSRLVPYLQNKLDALEDFFTWSEGSYVGEHKDGGKIAIAGIKARTADAERFQKHLLEIMKSQDKAMDRLAKSMVNYVKDIMK